MNEEDSQKSRQSAPNLFSKTGSGGAFRQVSILHSGLSSWKPQPSKGVPVNTDPSQTLAAEFLAFASTLPEEGAGARAGHAFARTDQRLVPGCRGWSHLHDEPGGAASLDTLLSQHA